MKFTLQIGLGNDEMHRPEHVADALRRVADEVESGHGSGSIRDVNGNTVGSYDLEQDET